MKTANQILAECGINTMTLNDEFNTQLFHAMEEYAAEAVKDKLNKWKDGFIKIRDLVLSSSTYITDNDKTILQICHDHLQLGLFGHLIDRSEFPSCKSTPIPLTPCVGYDIDFLVWYSGMDEQKIKNAYERYKREIEQGQP